MRVTARAAPSLLMRTPAEAWLDPEYIKSVRRRMDDGEHVSSIELAEIQEYFAWQREIRERVDSAREVRRQREEERLQSSTPMRAVSLAALKLNGTPNFDPEIFGRWLAEIADSAGPQDTPPAWYKAEEAALRDIKNALLDLDQGLAALAASHGERTIASSALVDEYSAAAARLVRRLERRPSWRNRLWMSKEMGFLVWDPWEHLQILAEALEKRISKVSHARRRGQPHSDYWKHGAAFEVAFALYRARALACLNSPIPNGRDGSDRAVSYVLHQLLVHHLGENLSVPTVEKFAKRGIATVRKLVAANFNDCAMDEHHSSVVALSSAPVHAWATERGLHKRRELDHEAAEGDGRWESKAAALRQAFLDRIGLWRAQSWKAFRSD